MQPYVLYSDFNCPFCYAMHEQLWELGLACAVEWRGVQHAPHLPVPMKAWHGVLEFELKQEVALVTRLVPQLAIAPPLGKPNTRAAIAAARVLQQDAAKGELLVRVLYAALWRDGLDLSNQTILHSAVSSVGAQTEALSPVSDAVDQILDQWDEQWRSTGSCSVPLLVSPEGDQLAGFSRAPDVLRFFSRP